MNFINLPYGVAQVLSAGKGTYIVLNSEFSFRTDLIIEKVYSKDVNREFASNELSRVSPLTASPGTLYHVPSDKFYSTFRT